MSRLKVPLLVTVIKTIEHLEWKEREMRRMRSSFYTIPLSSKRAPRLNFYEAVGKGDPGMASL